MNSGQFLKHLEYEIKCLNYELLRNNATGFHLLTIYNINNTVVVRIPINQADNKYHIHTATCSLQGNISKKGLKDLMRLLKKVPSLGIPCNEDFTEVKLKALDEFLSTLRRENFYGDIRINTLSTSNTLRVQTDNGYDLHIENNGGLDFPFTYTTPTGKNQGIYRSSSSMKEQYSTI